ncbi:hypothetical protein GALL_233690 [mine drainage metagenome]|uniref:Uncharacterized protein n=1 Tax=mine drainage metagenome TaxID=410659 RepID=A0A1J5RRV5_9ZZZZ
MRELLALMVAARVKASTEDASPGSPGTPG